MMIVSNFDDEKVWTTFFLSDNLKLWTRSSKFKLLQERRSNLCVRLIIR